MSACASAAHQMQCAKRGLMISSQAQVKSKRPCRILQAWGSRPNDPMQHNILNGTSRAVAAFLRAFETRSHHTTRHLCSRTRKNPKHCRYCKLLPPFGSGFSLPSVVLRALHPRLPSYDLWVGSAATALAAKSPGCCALDKKSLLLLKVSHLAGVHLLLQKSAAHRRPARS